MAYEDDIETREIGVSSAKVASFAAITQIVATIIGGIMLILVARMLGPSDYGIYTLAYGVAAFFGSFGVFGVAHYMNKYIPHMQTRNKKGELAEMIGESLLLLLLMCLAFVVLGTMFSGIIADYVFHSPAYVGLIIVSLFSIVFSMLMGLEYNILIGFKDGAGCALTFGSGNVAIAIISITLVYLGFGPMGAIIGTILGAAVGVVVGIAMIRKHSDIVIDVSRIRNNFVRIEHMLVFSLVLSASSMASAMLNNFAILLLGAYSLSTIVGSFGVAYKIGLIIVTVISFVSSVLIQMFSSALDGKNSKARISKLYNYSLYFGILISAPIAVYLATLPQAFVNSIFPAYRSARFFIPALSISILIGIIAAYASSLVTSVGDVKRVLKYALATSAVQLMLMIILVPVLNAYGVILGYYLAGSLVGDYLYIRHMDKKMHIKTSFKMVNRILLASVGLALVLLPLNIVPVSDTLKLLIGIVIVVILYPAFLGKTKAIGKKELSILDSVAKNTPVISRPLRLIISYAHFFAR
jgi:O-antigen/teichoic acid export membrane protein